MKTSERIKKMREKAKLRRVDFALWLGVNRSSVTRWEKGLHEPTLETLKKMAYVLKLDQKDKTWLING